MANSSSSAFLFHVEDQTDEDFFDRLVDDDFGITGSVPVDEGMGRNLSNMSLDDDIGTSSTEDGSGAVFGSEGGLKGSELEKVVSVVEESSTLPLKYDRVVPGNDETVETTAELGSPDSLTGKSGKGTSIKEVQWSVFTSGGNGENDLGGFGSYSDFFPENSSLLSDKESANPQPNSKAEESTASDVNAHFSSLEKGGQAWAEVIEQATNSHSSQQQATLAWSEANVQTIHSHSSQQQDVQASSDTNDPQYWENLYPGWKYDFNTGQWYQVNIYDSNLNMQLDSYESTVAGTEGSLQGKTQLADDNAQSSAGNEIISDERSNVSSLQQTAQSVYDFNTDSHSDGFGTTVAGNGIVSDQTSDVSYWEQTSQSVYDSNSNIHFGGFEGNVWPGDNIISDKRSDVSYWQQATQSVYGSNANVQLDGYGNTISNTNEGSQGKTHLAVKNAFPAASNEIITHQISDVSYLQQTAQSVTESVAEGCTTSSISGWDQVSPENNGYPANMIFDPQYPGWYYDVNTQLWQTLESYTQSVQLTMNALQNQLTQVENGTSDGYFVNQNTNSFNDEANQFKGQTLIRQTSQELSANWGSSVSNYSQQNLWQPEPTDGHSSLPRPSGNHQMNFHGLTHVGNQTESDVSSKGTMAFSDQGYGNSNGATKVQGFISTESMHQHNQLNVLQSQQIHTFHSNYGNQNIINSSQQPLQNGTLSGSQLFSPTGGRSSDGRPAHALVTFGFGGKLIIMKNTSFNTSSAYGSQDAGGGTISLLNLTDMIMEKSDNYIIGVHSHEYFHSLCQQSFPGPLVGGNPASKDLNKWIDERVASCESSSMDHRKGERLRLLLSLLKISHQYYGKLRSPFGTDSSLLENDGPESAVTKLFASSKRNGAHPREINTFSNCMHNLPNEGQIRATAAEVQTLLVSGKRKEALQCAQEGFLWGPALVLAAQLGEKFYIDTVKQMARCQFVSGSPLRTLCLLIAGQPADVFSDGGFNNSFSNKVLVSQPSSQVYANAMLDEWEENLAIVSANRTKDDELVIVHLGDCLLKERQEIIAAHTCYLVAEANFESHSDSARLCLIGADHWNCPRTYASPEAIQRTEFYEYSKVLGNSQFQLSTFQPYKLIYAYMLAEVGKVSDSLRYCQAILKLLKSSGRSALVEMLKLETSSFEERLRMHQQGGYGTNLAPAKLVGKLFTSIDKSIHRMIGAPPPPLPSMPENKVQSNEVDSFSAIPKVAGSQSTMAMSSLVPSASVEAISEWNGDNRRNMQNRSVSEPDFGKSTKQEQVNPSTETSSVDGKSKSSKSGGSSRFGLFGSQLLQKTVGWVSRSRSDRQAKLGEKNKFYYDEKLKRWVEEGAEPPAEEATPPPPPTMASFQKGAPDYNINSAFKSQSLSSNDDMETKPPTALQHSSGVPPIPPSQNQFSARGRMGVRSRYVDTFNKGGGRVATSSFQAPLTQSMKQMGGAKLFVPTLVIPSETTGDTTDSIQEASIKEDASSTAQLVDSSSSLLSSPPSYSMQRFSSMDSITPLRNKDAKLGKQTGDGYLTTRDRAASWSGSFSDSFNSKISGSNASANLVSPSLFTPDSSRNQGSPINGVNLGDELDEVEL